LNDLNEPVAVKQPKLLKKGKEVNIEEAYINYDVSYYIRIGTTARKEFQYTFAPQSLELSYLFKLVVRPHLDPIVENLKATSDRDLTFARTTIKLIIYDKVRNYER